MIMKYSNASLRKASLLMGCVVVAGFAVAGCTSNVSGKKLPELTFENVQPLYISAGRVQIANNYHPAVDDKDVSSRLPTRPDVAVQRWAERRLKTANGVGVMNFTIDSARVYEEHFGPANTVEKWTGQGSHTKYDAELKLSFSKQSDSRMNETRHGMTVTRSITVPDAWPIAKREEELQKFVETLVGDVDMTVTGTLHREGLMATPPFVTY